MSRLRILVVAGALLLSGCATVPTSGDIHEVAGAKPTPETAPFDFSPAGPRQGASRSEIVEGFLTAMLATPVSAFVARSFLTTQSASSWAPDSGTIIFTSREVKIGGSAATVSMDNPVHLDAQGRWLGRLRQKQVQLKLVRENGEWRISNPPDALMISRAHFEARFEQYSLYYFDPSGRVLVPEPVFVPWGVQAATRLVTSLLIGPPADRSSAERTYLPSTTELDISVPVIANGVADVPLSTPAADLSGPALERAVAQVAWTLRQVPGVSRVRLTVGGQPLDLPEMEQGVPVDSWSAFEPSVSWATPNLFGISGSRVVQVNQEDAAPSGLGQLPGGSFRSLGVSLDASSAAAVSADSEVYLLGTSQPGAKLLYRGGNVVRPIWDLHDDLWVYDRARPREVRIYDAGRDLSVIPLPLPDDFVPTSLALSRDGSRLVLGGRGGARVATVERGPLGRVTGLGRSARVLRADPTESVVSLAWATPTSVAGVLRSSTQRRLVVFSIDGSSPQGDLSAMPRDGSVVAARPEDAVIYAGAGAKLYLRAASGSWQQVPLGTPLSFPTFVG